MQTTKEMLSLAHELYVDDKKEFFGWMAIMIFFLLAILSMPCIALLMRLG